VLQTGLPVKRVRNNDYLYERGGTYYFRRAVPPDARAAFGGQVEVVTSLRTRSLTEARHRLAISLKAFDQCLCAQRGKPDPTVSSTVLNRTPSADEIEAAVRVWLRERRRREDNDFSTDEMGAKDVLQDIDLSLQPVATALRPGGGSQPLLTDWIADHICGERGWDLADQPTLRALLVRWVAYARLEIGRQRRDEINGEAMKVPDDRFSAARYAADRAQPEQSAPVSIIALFDGYALERKPAASTEKAWRRQLKAFVAFLGHDDATLVTTSDVIRWKDHLFAARPDGTQRSALTVKEGYLAALSTVMNWGRDNAKIAANPVAAVRVPRRRVATGCTAQRSKAMSGLGTEYARGG
jgi:hypothetical protein